MLLLITFFIPTGDPITFITGAVSPIVTSFLSNDIITSLCCFGVITNFCVNSVSANAVYSVPSATVTFIVYVPTVVGFATKLPLSS